MGIIGAGHVGSHVAMSLVIQEICRRVMLIDTDEKKARAQADDLMDGLCHLPWPVEIKAGSYEDLKDAQVVVWPRPLPPSPGPSCGMKSG